MKRELTCGWRNADIRYRYISRLSADDLHELFAEVSGQVLVEMVDGLVAAVHEADLGEVMRLGLELGDGVQHGLAGRAGRETTVDAGQRDRRHLHSGRDVERLGHGRE